MISPRLEALKVFSLLRVGAGLSILLNQLLVQYPHWQEFYGKQGMVNPNLFQFFSWSPLFAIWQNDAIKFFIFILGVVFSFMFISGIFARWVHIPLFAILLSFHLANPLVIHEPQQITLLLFFILWFVPYESHFSLKRSQGFETYESMKVSETKKIIFCIQLFLGYYYFLAGIKKIPDPLWLSGEALSIFLNSAYLGIENGFSSLFLNSWASKIASWSAILFELSFLPLSFTRWRFWLIPVGVVFHGANILLLDVGYFWIAMLMWYPVLLFKTDAKKSWAL